jgi:hypothetical protein
MMGHIGYQRCPANSTPVIVISGRIDVTRMTRMCSSHSVPSLQVVIGAVGFAAIDEQLHDDSTSALADKSGMSARSQTCEPEEPLK